MNSLFETLPYLIAYKVSFLVIGALVVISLIQNVLTAPLAFLKEEQIPGMPLQYDHSKLSFRVLRTHANSAESVPIFCISLLVAIIGAASSGWVNGLAVIYLFSRLAFWAFYYSGKGKIAGGPRTMAFVAGLVCNFILIAIASWGIAIH